MISLQKVGADVEVFVKTKDHSIVPVIGLIGGTKYEPRSVISPGFALQEDNVMAEFNIPPASDANSFSFYINRILNHLKGELEVKGYGVVIKSSHRFPPDLLYHPQALNIGCEPDYNAWTGEQQNPSDNPELETLRSCGGHVHISYKSSNNDVMFDFVKCLDVTLGVPSVIFDKDSDRRILYGKAGSFRPKPYGVEYRVLSNFWIKSKRYHEFVFRGVQRAIEMINKSAQIKPEVQEIINTANRKEAIKFCKAEKVIPEFLV